MSRVICPTTPEEWSGAEGCGTEFEFDVSDVEDDNYVECPSCGLAFDLGRATFSPLGNTPS